MKLRVVVLGAGFGGLELSSILSETIGDNLDLTLIDKNDSFFFGFSKLDVMFGRKTPDAVLLPYRNIVKPGVRFRQESITAIDPETRRVTTDRGTYEADVLVIALGADYDLNATPGLIEGGNEFYSLAGAERLREVIPTFSKGRAIVGVTSTPFKCPPAPSEASPSSPIGSCTLSTRRAALPFLTIRVRCPTTCSSVSRSIASRTWSLRVA